MKNIMYVWTCGIVFASTTLAGMDLATAKKQVFSNDVVLAQDAIDVIRKSEDRTTLSKVLKEAHNHSIKISAVKALGEIGKKEDCRILISQLETVNRTVVEGGNEQQAENGAIKKVLLEVLSRICGIPIPLHMDEESVSLFVTKCKSKIDL